MWKLFQDSSLGVKLYNTIVAWLIWAVLRKGILALKKILPVKQQFTCSAQEYQGRWPLLAGNTLTRYAAGHPSRLSEQVTRVLRMPFVLSREYSEPVNSSDTLYADFWPASVPKTPRHI